MPSRLLAVLGTTTAVAGGTAAAVAVHARWPDPKVPTTVLGRQVVNGDTNDPAAQSFVVSGDVDGLAPGVTRTLSLTLSNPNDGAISVRSLTVTVGDGRGGCTAGNVEVGPWAGPVLVPGRGRAAVSLPVTMLDSAPGVCQGATFPLTYGGSAVKA
ncbi:MAG TPA: hypothetical protein VFE55_11710 [Acidimicrobiia bacterium]|nr:hypothetical protein [Acidimicrobiia bacterium]